MSVYSSHPIRYVTKKNCCFFLLFFCWFFCFFTREREREKISPVLSINLTIQRNAMRTIYPEGNMSKRLVLALSHQFTLFSFYSLYSHEVFLSYDLLFCRGFFNFSLYIYFICCCCQYREERTKSISINCCSHILDCVNCEFSQRVKLVD